MFHNKTLTFRYKVYFDLIDDYFRFTWVYILKNKIHVFEKFKKFRELAEKKCGRPMNV